MKHISIAYIVMALISVNILASNESNTTEYGKKLKITHPSLVTGPLPDVSINGSLITFMSNEPTAIEYSIYDVMGNSLVPAKSMELTAGKNKDILPHKAVENIILVLKVTADGHEQLYKLIPKIAISNKVDGVSTKVSAGALAKIMGHETYVVK